MNFNSIKNRSRYFGAGPVLVGCLFALTLTATVWPLLSLVHEKYPDPVAGDITMKNLIKSADLHALMLLVGSAAIFTLGITVVARSTVPVERESDLQTVNQLLLFSLIPAGFRLATACLNDSKKLPPLLYVSLFPAAAIAVIVMLWRYRKQLAAEDFFVVGGAGLLTPFMAGFSALGLILTAGRLVPSSASGLTPIVYPFAVVVVVAAALALLLIWILSPTLELLRKRMLGLLMGCQYPLPLLLFYLVPPPLMDLTKQFRTPYPTTLVFVLGLLILLGVYRMVRRFHLAKAEPNRPLVKAISPVSVTCLMVFMLCGTATLPSPWHDFWDSGELLVPWQQIWDFHSLPFVNFCPIHGLMEITYGVLNQLFFSGTAATESCAETLVAGFGVALTALTACELLSPLAALFFLLALMPFADRFYFIAPTLFLVASPRLLLRPVRWLAVWIVICLLATAYNPALGPAFVLGTVPIALWQTWRAIRLARSQFAVLILCVGVAGAIVFLIHPLRQIAFGFLHFILDNAWTNDAANGIAWSTGAWFRDRTTGLGSSQFLWEFARSGWIAITIGAAVLCWKQLSKPATERSVPAIVLAVSAALTMLWSSVYTLGQIDPANLSRIGCMSEVALFFVTPALLFLAVPKRQQGLCALVVATGLGLLYPWQHYPVDPQIDPTPLLQKACAVRTIPAGTPMVDGASIGLPRLGQIIRANPDWTQNLVKLKSDLSTLLRPGETIFDLANQTAIYYYLDLKSPGQYAPWVAANSRLQATMMQQVQHLSVPAVLIGPNEFFDGIPPSIRCYRPYHDFTLKFTVLEKDGYTFLVDPARNPEAGPIGTEPQLQKLDSIFRRQDLFRLPLAWGDSFADMRNRFTSVAKIPGDQTAQTDAGASPTFTWQIPVSASTGAAADFFRFHLAFDPVDPAAYQQDSRSDPPQYNGTEPEFIMTWTNPDGSVSAPIQLRGHNGEHVVPLGAYPRWLLGSGFRTLNLTLQNPGCAHKMTVSDAEFLLLKPL